MTRFLALCAVLLALPAITAAQALAPGWYRNSGPSTIYEDSLLRTTWENSYIYPYPGDVPLYWYAKVAPYGSSKWVEPWYYSHPPNSSAPDVCPQELVTLGTCPVGPNPSVPHPGAYEIAQKISEVWTRFNELVPNDPPASLTHAVIGAACFTGTALLALNPQIGWIKAYGFEVKCATSLLDLAKSQCNEGDYACFITYMLNHPEIILGLLNEWVSEALP